MNTTSITRVLIQRANLSAFPRKNLLVANFTIPTTTTTLTATKRYQATGPYINVTTKPQPVVNVNAKPNKQMTKKDIRAYMGLVSLSAFISFCFVEFDFETGSMMVGDLFPYESVEACTNAANRWCHSRFGFGWAPLPPPFPCDADGRPLPSADQLSQFRTVPNSKRASDDNAV